MKISPATHQSVHSYCPFLTLTAFFGRFQKFWKVEGMWMRCPRGPSRLEPHLSTWQPVRATSKSWISSWRRAQTLKPKQKAMSVDVSTHNWVWCASLSYFPKIVCGTDPLSASKHSLLFIATLSCLWFEVTSAPSASQKSYNWNLCTM